MLTSPPFALLGGKEYGRVSADRYVEWFLPFAREIHRILKHDGSFVLDLGGTWRKGRPERSTYQFEVVVRLAEVFHFAQDIYWYDPTRLPVTEWVTGRRVRLKDAVNTVWWFSRSPHPKADNRRVLKPYSAAMRSELDRGFSERRVADSGHRIMPTLYRDNGGAIAPNLLTIANSGAQDSYLALCRKYGIKPHPARFPRRFVKFFVEFLTDPEDLVLDPFAGSNMTGAVSEELERRWLAFEICERYLQGARLRFE